MTTLMSILWLKHKNIKASCWFYSFNIGQIFP